MIDKTHPLSSPQNKNTLKNSHKVNDEKYIPDPYKKVATGMEKQFAEFMIQQMRKTTGEEKGSSAQDYYKGMMDSERAKAMSSGDGIGLKKMILDQIYPKRLRNKLAYQAYENQINQIPRSRSTATQEAPNEQ